MLCQLTQGLINMVVGILGALVISGTTGIRDFTIRNTSIYFAIYRLALFVKKTKACTERALRPQRERGYQSHFITLSFIAKTRDAKQYMSGIGDLIRERLDTQKTQNYS